MAAANASELFREMHRAVRDERHPRCVSDPTSPTKQETLEAKPGSSFTLLYPAYNLSDFRSIDLRWALVNVLHFFTGSEHADTLPKYNKHATRFLTGDYWRGAYGAIAMPQLRACVRLLREHPDTRRAVVSMGDCLEQDINRPACWSFMHFVRYRTKLRLELYQRSLGLFGVFPYDVVLISNIHRWVARSADMEMGELHWTIGSLHCSVEEADAELGSGYRMQQLLVHHALLDDPAACDSALRDPDRCQYQWIRELLAKEMRT